MAQGRWPKRDYRDIMRAVADEAGIRTNLADLRSRQRKVLVHRNRGLALFWVTYWGMPCNQLHTIAGIDHSSIWRGMAHHLGVIAQDGRRQRIPRRVIVENITAKLQETTEDGGTVLQALQREAQEILAKAEENRRQAGTIEARPRI